MTLQQRQHSLAKKTLFISCIVPVHNEEELIESFAEQLYAQLKQLTTQFEIIFIDDGSTDGSHTHLQNISKIAQMKTLVFSRNFGKEAALSAGLSHCKGDIAILMDADFQHPIELIPAFIHRWTEGYEMIYGVRRNRKNESFIKRFFATSFYKLIDMISTIHIPKHAGDFRLLDRKVIDALNQLPERERFMKGLYAWVGFKSLAYPFDVGNRTSGISSWKFGRLFELAFTGIASFSNIPLRIWSFIGALISLISFIYALWIVLDTLFFGIDVPGFATITVAIIFFGGIQLLSIGVLGEYISRIFNEVKQRPQYIIAKKNGFDE